MAELKSGAYWKKRQEQYFRNLEKDEKQLLKKMDKYYAQEAKRLDKDIAAYYTKYGADGVIEYKNLLVELNPKEKRELIEDMDTFFSTRPELDHLRPIRESAYKIDRLDSLRCSVTKGQIELGEIEEQMLRDHLSEGYVATYNDMMKKMGYSSNFLSVDNEKVRNLINSKWVANRNFSDSIWGNKEKLINYMTKDFTQGIIRGDNYDKLGKLLGDKFTKASRSDIKRLVYTEGTFVQNQSMASSFIDMGYEEYEYDALLDERTTDECRGLDGERFRFDEMEVGKNFSPLHIYCRSSFKVIKNENRE